MSYNPVYGTAAEFDDTDPAPEPAKATRQGKPKGPAIFSAKELGAMQFPPIKWIVPDVLPEGATILAGKPKLGKSWMALDIALAVARGNYCLGDRLCPQGDVLYLALEDNRRRLQSRIDRVSVAGSAEPFPERLDFATEWPRCDAGGVEAIRAWAASRPDPRLVVIDVLAMFKPTRGNQETGYEHDYSAVKAVQELAGDLGLGVLIVHHVRKGIGESDPFEKVSGTLGLTGAADTALILDRDGNGISLYGRGRDISEFEKAIAFSKDACRWTLQGDASEVRRTDERGTILDILLEATEPLSPKDIAVASGMARNSVDQLLYKMGKSGEALKAERGRYVHPDKSNLME
ncbi:AAA family ATPase [Aestuariivirga sp.]|uniref:AAA family ATPase n=1 Tax=Aestuariivirga sp. TaxID=2650926 RepID=UPI0037852A7E